MCNSIDGGRFIKLTLPKHVLTRNEDGTIQCGFPSHTQDDNLTLAINSEPHVLTRNEDGTIQCGFPDPSCTSIPFSFKTQTSSVPDSIIEQAKSKWGENNIDLDATTVAVNASPGAYIDGAVHAVNKAYTFYDHEDNELGTLSLLEKTHISLNQGEGLFLK